MYSLSDVTIIPEIRSYIRHRSECNPYYENKLPIFTAPMDSVVNVDNFDIWEQNHINAILPRTETIKTRAVFINKGYWTAISLEEFKNMFCDEPLSTTAVATYRILIDIANGHIFELQNLIKKAKENAKKYNYTLYIMAGNVANEMTYKMLADAGADYVRCSIGTGSCCITSSNTAVHMPMATLLDRCLRIKKDNDLQCKIIADGGINSYSNAIKALALGADYVMIGTTLAKCFESAAEFMSAERPSKEFTYLTLTDLNNLRFNSGDETYKKSLIRDYSPLKKAVYGMSTRKAQIKIQKAQGKINDEIKTKTSEGIEKEITIDYTVKQWTENFTDYLRSAMSYCNARNLDEFVGNVELAILSEGAKNSINK